MAGPDPRSVATFGWDREAAPAAPTALSVVNDGDGDAITATVTGAEGATIVILYKTQAETAYTAGQSGTISGGTVDINQTGLDDATWYIVTAVTLANSIYSLPVGPLAVLCTSSSGATFTGDISLAMENLRILIGSSTSFQTWIGATGVTAAARLAEAKAHIHLGGVSIRSDLGAKPTDPQKRAAWAAKRPLVIISPGAEWSKRRRAVGGPYDDSAELVAHFEDDVATDDIDKIEDPLVAFANELDATLEDMLTLAGTNGYLRVAELSMVIPPTRSDRKMNGTFGDHQFAGVAVRWG